MCSRRSEGCRFQGISLLNNSLSSGEITWGSLLSPGGALGPELVPLLNSVLGGLCGDLPLSASEGDWMGFRW